MSITTKVKAELSTYDRDLILQHVMLMHSGLEDKILSKRARNGSIKVDLTKEELADLIGCVAREANHTANKNLENDLDELFGYLENLEFDFRGV
jgi:hypothetical protein